MMIMMMTMVMGIIIIIIIIIIMFIIRVHLSQMCCALILIYEGRKSVTIFALLSALILATMVSSIRADC